MFELCFDGEAINFLNTLPFSIKDRIFNKLVSTKVQPFRFFERLTGRSDYKLRVGDYRVVADIIKKDKTIRITIVGHRKNIYKKIKGR
jgi:mRNA interferase RelE/StbE